MPALSLRRYEPTDADAVWDLHVSALSDAGAYDEEFAHRDADLRAVEVEYLDAGGEFLVGEREGDLVAMGGFQPHDDRDEAVVLRRMRVDPAHQRRGHGTAVLEALEDRALERGYGRATLDTTARQRAAVAFYQAHGYDEVRRETIRDHEMIWYEKPLSAD